MYLNGQLFALNSGVINTIPSVYCYKMLQMTVSAKKVKFNHWELQHIFFNRQVCGLFHNRNSIFQAHK